MRGQTVVWVVALCISWSAACTRPVLRPYTAADLSRDAESQPGRALLRYLTAQHADPAVCRQPFVQRVELNSIDAIVHAGGSGRVQTEVFLSCMKSALEQWNTLRQRRALSKLGEAYFDALEEANNAPKLLALRELVLLTPTARSETTALDDIPARLSDALEDHDFKRPVEALAREWLVALELSRGRYQSKPLTTGTIRSLNDNTLQLASAQLSDAALRDTARAELVRRRATRSQYAIVHENVEATVQSVMLTGHNALLQAQHPVKKLWFDPKTLPAQLSVYQDAVSGTALLMAASEKTSHPYFSLRDVLRIEAAGIPLQVKLCASFEALDPAPCIPSDALTVEAEESLLDERGMLHLPDTLPLSRMQVLAVDRKYVLRVKSADVTADASLPLALQVPHALEFSGTYNGTNGPALEVQVDEREGFALFTVDVASKEPARRQALLDLRDPGAFKIASVGAQGYAGRNGSDGSSGSDGSDGSSASCGIGSAGNGSSGGSGGNGGSGSAGGRGGNGGDVHVRVHCSSAACSILMAMLPAIVQSVGGPGGRGGAGGRGGKGGRGGRGGSGTSCTVTDSQGRSHSESKSSGWSGSDGTSGFDGTSGMHGASGEPGKVSIVRVD
jgi:hypothetical protein